MIKNKAINGFIEQKFPIDLSPNLLLQIMTCYHLKAQDISGDYTFDLAQLDTLINTTPFNEHKTPINSLLNNTLSVLNAWPKQLSWLQFNQHIINLLTHWLADYEAGTQLDDALMLSRCLKLNIRDSNTPDKFAVDDRFQLLLMHLIARITNQFDQYNYQYSQHFDLASGLPNHHLMLDVLRKADLEKNHIGLILINLNFGNESLLKTASSNLLLAATDLINQHLNDDASVFYVEANELAIIIEHLRFPAQLNLIASKLGYAFESALQLENNTLILKPYFGATSSFKRMRNAPTIYDCAKLALHHAMVNNYKFEIYDPQIITPLSSIHQLEEAVIQALQQNELEVYLQPIVTLANATLTKNTCESAELLLRWHSADWTSISPMRLIDTIYKKGFGQIFIRWLINTACQRVAKLMSIYQHKFSLTINLCANDLLDTDLPELLAQSIALWDIPADTLVIEITESDLLLDETKAMLVIEKIVALGCKLALDDFGTGYSSMTRLRNMPIDIVKMDQSFVGNVETSIQDKEIVLSIIQLAHSLGKTVVAEGVETVGCLDILKQMQCEKIQGYYFAKPMAFNDFTAWKTQFEAG